MALPTRPGPTTTACCAGECVEWGCAEGSIGAWRSVFCGVREQAAGWNRVTMASVSVVVCRPLGSILGNP